METKEEFIAKLKAQLPHLPPEKAKDVLLYLERETIKSAQTHYPSFVRLMGPVLMEGFEYGRHMEIIAEALDEAVDHAMKKGESNDRRKLQISMPPAYSKTQLCVRMLAAFILGKYPQAKIIFVGASLLFGKDEVGMKILDIIRSEEYKRIFPNTELREDKQTAGRFLTTHNGELFVTSLVGGTAGRRGHFILSDDTIIEQDAYSREVRTNLTGLYTSNIRTRFCLGFKGAEIVVGTKWVQGDLFSTLENTDRKTKNPFRIIKIPAILDEQSSLLLRRETDPEGYLVPGTSSWPEVYSTAYFEDKKREFANNPSRYQALYQQNPIPEEGQIIGPKDFRLWEQDEVPAYHTSILSLDTAYTTNSQSDFTAFQLWGIFNRTEQQETKPNLILLNANKGKWDFSELLEKIEHLYYRKRPDFILIEERSSGLALIPELRNRGLPVMAWKTDKDKILRMQAVAPLVKSGIVWVPFPEGNDEVCQKSMDFIGEIAEFPGGAHDDVPDCFSQTLLWMRDQGMLIGKNYDITEEEFYEDGEPTGEGFPSYTSALLRK